jgi:hypothetical protein
MKKILIILLFIILSSCNNYIVTNVHDKSYIDKEMAMIDIYNRLYYYDIDSIDLNDWIYSKMVMDTTIIDQKIIRKLINNKSSYTFIFTTYKYPSLIYYNFLIRYSGKIKDYKL